MARGRVIKALAVNADDSTKTDANEPLDSIPLPTLDERANFYLRAVHGERRFSDEEYSGARDLMLRAMAEDIAARSSGRPSDDALLSLGEQHNGLTAFADTSLMLGTSEQPADVREAAPVVPDEPRIVPDEPRVVPDEPRALFEPRALLQRLPSFSALPRMAAICAAAAVAAVAGYSAAGITARFVPNTTPPGASLTVQVAPPDPLPGSPSNPRIVAEAQREIQSALNTAQLSPDEVAALLKRGQEFVAQGSFRFARLVLEQAAEAKSAAAALALARTYDPLMERPAIWPDAPPDLAMARVWYEKAKDLGSPEAAQRLTQLPASVPATRFSPK